MIRTSFLNVDLQVYAGRSLRRLASAMEQLGAVTLQCGRLAPGRYRASFEPGHQPRSADPAIRALAKLVRRLPEPASSLWATATLREFSVGIVAGSRPFSFESAIKPPTVRIVAALDAQISYTIYSFWPG